MIKTSEDANKYYNLVNQYIDEYVETWKIKPANLKGYLLGNKSKLSSFLERNGLQEVTNIEIVIKDVIDDRIAMFSDAIMTFENYKVFESDEYKILDIKQCIWKGIGKSDMQHEKLLADLFDVSLSQIDCVDSAKHIFQIDGSGHKVYCVVFKNEELQIIKENIKAYAFNQITSQNLNLPGVKVDFNLGKFVDLDKYNTYIDSVFTEEKMKDFISQHLNCDEQVNNVSSDYFVGLLK